jgi:SEFIR domain
MSKKKVFISYSHDSDEHRERVLALSERLRKDGLETLLDQYVNGSPKQGWPRWMLDQLDAADSVLVVCTETYYCRFRGHEEPGKGKGVDWEGALITQDMYDRRSQTLKFVPIFLSAAVQDWIPEPLRLVSYYALTSESAYQGLYDFLLEQAGVDPQPVGVLKTKPRRKGTALTFDLPPTYEVAKPDISRIDRYAPAQLIGRETETELLSDAWEKAVRGETKRPHVLTFVALGGEGKTSLVAKWAADLAHQNWPGCEAVFAWSFYSQGTREQTAASSDLFLKEALTAFGEPALAGSAQGAFDKGRRLAQLVGERRALLILDGLEPLQYAPTSPTRGELKDQGIAALLKGLAAANHGLCVVTTRYSIPDLRVYWQTTAPETKLLRLSKAVGVALLKSLGVKGTQQEFETLVEDVQGHALTLNLLGSYLHDAYAGDIRKRHLVKLEEADAEEQGGHAFRVMDAYVRWFESEEEKMRPRRVAAAGVVRPARDRRLPRRVAESARHPGPDRGARRDERGAAQPGLYPAGGREAAHGEPGRGRQAGLAGCPLAAARILRPAAPHATPRGLARRPPAALRTPLRDHEGQTPATTGRPATALPSRGARLPGGDAAGGV